MRLQTRLASYTDAELRRWLHLRAMEWTGLTTFITQPIVPILFCFLPWWEVIVALVCTDFVWSLIAYRLVNVGIANAACIFVIVCKWPACIGFSIYLFKHEKPLPGVLSLLWPFVAGFVRLPAATLFALLKVPKLIGTVERALAEQIGYVERRAGPPE